MRPGSSGNPNLGYAPSPVAYPPGSLPYGAMPTPGGGQKRKLEGDISTNPHIPAGPGPGAGLGPGGGPMMVGTSATTPSGQAQPGPATAAATTTGAPASTSQPERKFRPPMPPPHLLASLVPESKMFKDLIEMEQRLDWTMLRKRAEVNDALGRVVKVSQQQRRIRPMARSRRADMHPFGPSHRSRGRYESIYQTRREIRNGSGVSFGCLGACSSDRRALALTLATVTDRNAENQLDSQRKAGYRNRISTQGKGFQGGRSRSKVGC